jgi:ribosome maturation factor RimP
LANAGLIEELKVLFTGFLEGKGLELVELLHQYSGPKLVLTVLADRPQGGITLAECARACKELKDLLEEKGLIGADYFLEVASPGLDRPLSSRKDFKRSTGREAVFFLNDPVNGKIQWQGMIRDADENSVFIQVKEEQLGVPLVKINKAKLVF